MTKSVVPWGDRAGFASQAKWRPLHQPLQPSAAKPRHLRQCPALPGCRTGERLADAAGAAGRDPGRGRRVASACELCATQRWPARPACPIRSCVSRPPARDARRAVRRRAGASPARYCL